MTLLSQEHDDQALTDPDPVARLVVLHIAWQSSAAFTHGFHPTGGHGNVLFVHLKSDLYVVRHKGHVCYIPHSRTYRLEANCAASRFSTRVGSAVSDAKTDCCCDLRAITTAALPSGIVQRLIKTRAGSPFTAAVFSRELCLMRSRLRRG